MKLQLETDDYTFARSHNQRLFAEQVQRDKEHEEQTARRKVEWEAMDEALKVCDVCTLPLDDESKARIAASPMAFRRHEFCKDFYGDSHSIRGLVGLLKELFGEEEEVPLTSLRQVIDAWKKQSATCAISRIKLSFPADGVLPTPKYDGSLMSSMDRAVLQHQYEKEQRQKDRQGELHSPVIDFDSEGKLRLVSRTIQRWREGLEDSEFADLVRTLNGELHSAFPESRSFNPAAVGRLSMNRRLIR